MPAVPVQVVDTTGAGDAFAAGLLTARLGGAGRREALEAGCAVAARAVAQVGARPPETSTACIEGGTVRVRFFPLRPAHGTSGKKCTLAHARPASFPTQRS